MTALKYDERLCPNCGAIATADFVDNGVGNQQCGPFHCEACGWTEPSLDFNLKDEEDSPF